VCGQYVHERSACATIHAYRKAGPVYRSALSSKSPTSELVIPPGSSRMLVPNFDSFARKGVLEAASDDQEGRCRTVDCCTVLGRRCNREMVSGRAERGGWRPPEGSELNEPKTGV